MTTVNEGVSLLGKAQQRIFEHMLLGIVQIDREQRVVYANQKAKDIFGVQSVAGWTFDDVPVDAANRELLKRQFKRRLEGSSGQYELTVERQNDGCQFPVRVFSVPEVDAENRIVGAFAILRSLEIERAVERIHAAIESSRSLDDLLEAVAVEARRVMPFEVLAVSLLSADGRHLRLLFQYPKTAIPQHVTRWYTMPPWMVEWVQNPRQRLIPDLEEFLSQPGAEQLREDPGVQALVAQGINSWIRYPIYVGERLIATISMGSRMPDLLEQADRRLEKLPLTEAVRMAIFLLEIENQMFRLSLLKQMSECREDAEVMAIITKELAQHHGWDNVSIWSVDVVDRSFELENQSAGPEGYLFPDSPPRPLDRGLMGEAFRRRQTQSLPQVKNDDRFDEADFHHLSCSALAVPIEVDGELRWILNVEDRRASAFADEEITLLEEITRDVVDFLGHLLDRYLAGEMLRQATDAIVTTDDEGAIQSANDAAEYLLGVPQDDLRNRYVHDFFTAPDRVDSILENPRVRDRLRLAERPGRESREIFLTGARLPVYRRYVFFMKDLGSLQRLAELEQIQAMFRNIAVLIRTPISLLFSYLRRLSSDPTSGETAEFVDKARRQLRKIELTYEQLVLYDNESTVPFNPIPLALATVIESAIRELPKAAAESIDCQVSPALPRFRGDPFQMNFILQTILGHLLRFVPIDEKIRLRAAAADGALELSIAGFIPSPRDGQAEPALACGTRFSDSIIERFIEQHRGTYRPPAQSGAAEFRITLPVTRV